MLAESCQNQVQGVGFVYGQVYVLSRPGLEVNTIVWNMLTDAGPVLYVSVHPLKDGPHRLADVL